VQDLHWGGAIMWVGGDAIMFGLMMLVFLMWSRDERPASGRGWLEDVRRTSMASLVASHPASGSSGGIQPGGIQPGGIQPGGDQPGGDQPVGGQPSGSQATAGDWSGRGSIDDDEHLAAYNAFLARLNKSEPGRQR
jgi:hypothetical protein